MSALLHRLSRLWRRQPPAPPALPAGSAVNRRYEILCQLGGSHCDRTYLAEDWWYGGWCVLTEFAPRIRHSQELALAREQVQESIQVLQQLDHPQIPEFREVFECQAGGLTRWVVVQEWIEGLKYVDLIKSKPFTETEVVQFLQDALPALDYLHQQKPPMLHRNIKPSTLLQSRENGKPVLIQFGDIKEIAALVSRPGANQAMQALDARFQPPEYHQGDFYPSGDLYGLAVTALTMLTGCGDPERLYDPKTQRWRWARYTGVSIGLAVILERMLQGDPALRYPSAKAVLAALKAMAKKQRLPVPKQSLLLTGKVVQQGAGISPGEAIATPGAAIARGYGSTLARTTGRGNFAGAPGMTITVEALKQTSEVLLQRGQSLVQGVGQGVRSGYGKLRGRSPKSKLYPLPNC